MKIKDFENISKSVVENTTGMMIENDIEVKYRMFRDDAVKLAKSLTLGNGIYFDTKIIDTMGGFKFSLNKVKFVIEVK